MGLNATTFVPTYVASEVLTAADLNVTNSGVPVFADTTARDAAFGGTGEKVLAEGQLAYVENLTGDAQIQYYDGASWVSLASPALTLISSTTIGTTVSSVTVTGAFSATYENYKIIISGGVASTTIILKMQLSGLTTNYYGGAFGTVYNTNAFAGLGHDNTNEFESIGTGLTAGLFCNIDVLNPFLAKPTWVQGSGHATGSVSFQYAGYQSASTSVTDFIIATSAGTITGGTIRVYGYKI